MTIGQYIDDSHSLSFIHSGHFYIAPVKSSTTQRRSRLQHGYCIGVLRRSAQATAGKGLAQGPYVAARAGVEPTTLRLKVIVSTKVPPRQQLACYLTEGCKRLLMKEFISHFVLKSILKSIIKSFNLTCRATLV